jgi:hypothetical protein
MRKYVLIFIIALFFISCTKGNLQDTAVINDIFNSSSTIIGQQYGITYVNTPYGKGALFSSTQNSRIEYSYSNKLPRSGTYEFLINISSGYYYSNYNFNDTSSVAQLFGSDCYGGDVNWPGAFKLLVSNNGTIQFILGYQYATSNAYKVLSVNNTSFNFNKYHTVGFSIGNQGLYLDVDHKIVYSNLNVTDTLNAAGNFTEPIDVPTIGQCISKFWASNQYDGGFNGIVVRFRASNIQRDFRL